MAIHILGKEVSTCVHKLQKYVTKT